MHTGCRSCSEGERIQLIDARGRKRQLQVVELRDDGVVVQGERTAYLRPGIRLVVQRPKTAASATEIRDLPAQPGQLHLSRGQMLRLTAQGLGHDARPAGAEGRAAPATIACTLPEVLAQVREGERIWFDDGRIGGIVRRAASHRLDIEITEAGADGESLAADKGINLPDSQLELPALTDKDLADLAVVARYADMVGLSFVQSAADVRALHQRLDALCASQLGVVLKIETRRGFENLPELLFAAMAGRPAGVMIARGDLAVECGFERLAELQEEILWVCEAAHMPVVWATQVLENLAKTGRPSRAEITDAAMGVRADCVMLNKGAAHPRGDAHARRHPAPHAGAPVEEAQPAAGAEGLGLNHPAGGQCAGAARRRQAPFKAQCPAGSSAMRPSSRSFSRCACSERRAIACSLGGTSS